MNAIKLWLLGVGVVAFCAGIFCMPFPIVSPYARTGIWPYVTATGGLVKYGLALAAVGLLLIVISLFIPKEKS